jgi:hypothetical protein
MPASGVGKTLETGECRDFTKLKVPCVGSEQHFRFEGYAESLCERFGQFDVCAHFFGRDSGGTIPATR